MIEERISDTEPIHGHHERPMQVDSVGMPEASSSTCHRRIGVDRTPLSQWVGS